MKTILDFFDSKKKNKKISMITCYDYTSAVLVNKSNVDCILVGDSLAMTMLGADSTIPATTDIMALHISSVKKGAPDKFIVGDMPFLSYRKNLTENMNCVEKLMHAGSHALKLEGATGNIDFIKHVVQSGVPVMGHLGLTPQSVHQLGGFRVQGRGSAAKKLIEHALELEQAGCFSLVLEAVPAQLAEEITEKLQIPTIGIGAGAHTDGQVLVLQDLLGLNTEFKPKFVRSFLNGGELFINAFNQFDSEVKQLTFPTVNESYEA